MEIDFQKKPMKLYSTGKQVIASTPTIPSNSRLCNTAENMRGIDQLTESSRNLLYDFKADLRRLDSLIKAHAHQLNPYSIHLSLRPELSIFEETNRIDSLFLYFRQEKMLRKHSCLGKVIFAGSLHINTRQNCAISQKASMFKVIMMATIY